MLTNEIIDEIMKLYLQSVIDGNTNPFENPSLTSYSRESIDKALANCINYRYVDGLIYAVNEKNSNIYSATDEIKVTKLGMRFLNH